MSLGIMTIDEYVHSFANFHPTMENFQMVILSLNSIVSPDMNKLIEVFTAVVWMLILISMIQISFFNLIYQRMKSKWNEIKNYKLIFILPAR